MDYPLQALCPCCRFPTLSKTGDHEICTICWWHDDGQTDQDAGEVYGGPNRHYSLLDARRNFIDHGHIFDLGRGIEAVDQPSARRVELIAYLESIAFDPGQADKSRMRQLLRGRGY